MNTYITIFISLFCAVALIEMFLHQDALCAWEDKQIARFRAWYTQRKAEISARIINLRLGAARRKHRKSEKNLIKITQRHYIVRLNQTALAYDERQAELRARKEAILKQ